MMRMRVRALMAVVIATAATIGGALTASASASAPLVQVTITCTVNGIPTPPDTIIIARNEVRKGTTSITNVCDAGSVTYTVTKLG